jgi:hypothetical protein
VAVVAAIGVLGGDGGDDRSSATPTTRERRTSTTRHRVSTTTTATTLLGRVIGTGPLLPGDPSGTVLGIVDSTGVATVVDLDSGDGCSVKAMRADPWSPWPARDVKTLWVQSNDDLVEVDTSCTATPRSGGFTRGWPAAFTETTVWLVRDQQGVLEERDLATDTPTGRTIAAPTNAGLVAVTVDDDLVIGAMGDMTHVDVATGRRRSLGAGMPLGGRDGLVYFTACPALECHVGVVDVVSGERAVVSTDVEVAVWEPAAVSPDGRHIRVTEITPSGTAAAVIDVRSGAVVRIDLELAVFSADGRWLIGLDGLDVGAARLDDPSTIVTIELGPHPVRVVAVLAAP